MIEAGLTGGALGAAFGALGSILNRGFGVLETREKRKDRQLELAHEKERWAHEDTARADDARNALAQTQAQGSWAGLNASVEAEGAIGASWPWVSAVRALTRPGLTVMLWLLYAMLFLSAASGALEADTASSVIGAAVDTVSFSAATALTWWFGDRAPRREP